MTLVSLKPCLSSERKFRVAARLPERVKVGSHSHCERGVQNRSPRQAQAELHAPHVSLDIEDLAGH